MPFLFTVLTADLTLSSVTFSLGTEESDSEETKLKGHNAGDEKREENEQLEDRCAIYASTLLYQEPLHHMVFLLRHSSWRKSGNFPCFI